jgi:membrane protein
MHTIETRPATRAFMAQQRERIPKKRMPHRSPWALLKCAMRHWSEDQAATMGAALAFYCAFSLAPLLVILVTVASWVIGQEMAYGHLGEQLAALFGKSTAAVLLEAMRSSQQTEGIIATVLSIFSLLVGATTVFAALEAALEQIWGAKALVPGGAWGWVRSRVLSFGLILAFGVLLLVSLTVTTAITALRAVMAERVAQFVVLVAVLDFVATTGLVTGMIALVYRYMPAKRLPWRSVLWGALVTALLFHAGRWAIGLYLGRSTQPSAFGAAASFVALLLWLYYSAQILLLGAEFTACLGGLHDEERRKPAAPQEPVTKRSD